MDRNLSEEQTAALADFLSFYLKETGRAPLKGLPENGTGVPFARMIAQAAREQRK